MAEVQLRQGQLEFLLFCGRLHAPMSGRSPALPEHPKEVANVEGERKGHAALLFAHLVSRNLSRGIVMPPLSVVAEYFIGLLHLLEGLLIAALVRMVLKRELVKGALHIARRGRTLNTEQFVEVLTHLLSKEGMECFRLQILPILAKDRKVWMHLAKGRLVRVAVLARVPSN